MNRREGASAMYAFSKRRTCINRLSVNLLLREYYNLSTATALSSSVPPSAWLTDPVLCYNCIWSVYAQPVPLNTWCGTTEQERVMFQMSQVYSEDIVPSYEQYTSLLVEWQLHCTGSSSFSKCTTGKFIVSSNKHSYISQEGPFKNPNRHFCSKY